jgi:hypothetical protein
MASPITSKYTILFHGNCIDGWMSTYIAHSILKNMGQVKMYPISPSQPNTWPKMNIMSGSHVILLDVSVAEIHRKGWITGGVLSISCIDHHASAIGDWPADSCPINTASCAAIQTWQRFYPGVEIPYWLHTIDRIDRWDNPSYEDRCIREVLNIIAHKPVQRKFQEALTLTDMFLANINNAMGAAMVLKQGKEILDQKDAALMTILNKGSFHTFTQEYITGWNLPQSWLGANVFIIDNTGITLDTTEAAHLVFMHYPQVHIFINYRKKGFVDTQSDDDSVKTMYVYSARSRGFDLTMDNSPFKGHPTAAGMSLVKEYTPVLPFLLVAA